MSHVVSRTPPRYFIVCLLGALSIISPFSIDMYLPAFSEVAEDFGVPNTDVPLTVSSYFIGLALGQVFYGPLLDRFGRKAPLYGGLGLFVLASAACALAPGLRFFIVARFIQGLGGCVAQVASLAMVRDFFPKDGAKILSLLFLFIAVSPLLAPSVGGMLSAGIGWRSIFLLLMAVVAAIIGMVYFLLPESHTPDASISLRPLPIIQEYFAIALQPRFATYALSGGFSFAGLFGFIAGSPLIFMDGFSLSAQAYSAIFALLAAGFIGGSQLNVYLLRTFDSATLYRRVLLLQTAASVLFAAGTYAGWLGLEGTLAMFFVFLGCAGLTYPNAAALALAPFTRNAGSASAMLGFLQLGIGALISSGISMWARGHDSFPIIAILAVTTLIGLGILLAGRKRAHAPGAEEENQ